MVIVKATKDSEAGVMPSEQLLTEMGKFNEELVQAGIMQAGEGLHPTSNGARVRFSGNKRTVIDGPFAETKELIAGFWLWKVKSKAEAIEWVKRCPNPHNEDGEIEIRQIFEAEDFGAELTPELRRQEAGIRAQALGLGALRFEKGKEMTVAGLNQSYTFENRVKIPMQWENFAPHIGKVPGQIGNVAYGVCWNYRAGKGFDYLSGVEVNNSAKLPGDFSTVRLTAEDYVVFIHADNVSSIVVTIEKIWNSWVPQSGLKIKDGPWFERYTEAFNPQTGMGGMEIWLPIAP
jgi:predicted transcriptional regulator YdeE